MAIAALEIAALPAAAHKFGAFDFQMSTIVAAVDMQQSDGMSTYMVTSDGPFAITSKNAIGSFEIRVFEKGAINSTRFGDNAQLPGAAYACLNVDSAAKSVIYDAGRKTAVTDGEVLSQAVLVTVTYPKGQSPKLKFVADKRARKLPRAEACIAA